MNTSVDIMMATSYQEGNHHGFFKGGTFFMTIFGTLSHDHRQSGPATTKGGFGVKNISMNSWRRLRKYRHR
jgi:hypothetical protein